MRRILFTLLASGALFAGAPAAALARDGEHHGRHHHPARHHVRVRHERFVGARHDDLVQNAGTVAAFGNGTLTIKLNDGSTVTGAVTPATEIECEAPLSMQRQDRGPGGGSGGGGGDENGRGDANDRGDDNDAGDDNGRGDDDNQGAEMCMAIAPGVVVRDASLAITGNGSIWSRVDLIDQ